jgi:hypothetical protein
VSESVSIPERFNGPLDSGNGGYCSGVAAAFLDDPVEVSLRRPVPLDSELAVARDGVGGVHFVNGDAPVVEARAVPEVEVEVPPPPSMDEARLAAARYRGVEDGVFSRCFVCGLARPDAFGVYAGEVEGRELVASPWTPPSWTADHDGHVRPEFVWAVLDCPTYFAAYMHEELTMSVLARLTARIEAPVVAGTDHVVMAWPIDAEGRKRHAGSAVLSPDGEPLAVARALLIEPRRITA